MVKSKRLSKKQLVVIDDMFSGELDEQVVLDRHKVSRNLYNRWLADELFAGEFSQRIASAHRQIAILIAKYAPVAAAKLVQLTESENQETVRKACLDIISQIANSKSQIANGKSQMAISDLQIEPETASRLLAALAEATDEPHPFARGRDEGRQKTESDL